MSSGHGIKEGREEAIKKSADETSELKAEGIEKANKANFFLFFRSSRELFL